MKLTLWETALAAERELGIKLEYVNGIPVWEAHPAVRHQKASYRIQQSIRSTQGGSGTCACVHYADVYVRFPDGSLKRPDISIFCREPDEQETAVTLLPEAVIEIISKDYAEKDLQIGVPFYIAQGVKDVVVFDPDTGQVTHHHHGITDNLSSPVPVTFSCGCTCTV